MSSTEALWRAFSKESCINWINLLGGKGSIAGIAVDYRIRSFSTYVLIALQRVIIENGKAMGLIH
jgi:hypothetical protein